MLVLHFRAKIIILELVQNKQLRLLFISLKEDYLSIVIIMIYLNTILSRLMNQTLHKVTRNTSFKHNISSEVPTPICFVFTFPLVCQETIAIMEQEQWALRDWASFTWFVNSPHLMLGFITSHSFSMSRGVFVPFV